MKTPNLLFLYTDEQRFDTLAVYGNEKIVMPNLNRLSEQSCVFDRAYVTQPVCTPSRSSLLTGRYPHNNGCTANNLLLDYAIPCLPEMLSGKYVTAHFGKWHLGDELFPQHGFRHWLSIEDQYNRWFRPDRDRELVSDYCRWVQTRGRQPENGRCFSRDEAARLPEELSKPAFLAEQASRFINENQKQPFCLYVNFLEPHMPFTGPRDNQYDPAQVPLPVNFDSPPTEGNHLKNRMLHAEYAAGNKFGCRSNNADDVRRLTARYWGLCSQVDSHCGAILDTLQRCNLWDDTIIVFTSDHGDMMGSHQLIAKCVMYEEAVRVPLLVKLPGQRQLRRIEGPVSQVDLVPTLLELMGAAAAAGLDGRSLVDAMQANPAGTRNDVVIEWNGVNSGLDADDPAKANLPETVMHLAPPEQLIEAVRDPLRTVVARDGRWKLTISPLRAEHELYDLVKDPGERANRYGDRGLGKVTAGLRKRLRQWQQRTGDTVAIPKG